MGARGCVPGSPTHLGLLGGCPRDCAGSSADLLRQLRVWPGTDPPGPACGSDLVSAFSGEQFASPWPQVRHPQKWGMGSGLWGSVSQCPGGGTRRLFPQDRVQWEGHPRGPAPGVQVVFSVCWRARSESSWRTSSPVGGQEC